MLCAYGSTTTDCACKYGLVKTRLLQILVQSTSFGTKVLHNDTLRVYTLGILGTTCAGISRDS